ncbi:MAG: PucR family transcriptional regulator ligand-binding domain-containing protein, partial [Microthrixaceae bacterium]
MVILADLLSHTGLRLRPVVDLRRSDAVRWVATSEIANPAPFLEGGEVLLTTGLETAEWQHQWDKYVARLVKAGVVAIGLGLGFTHASAPGALVVACRHHGLDLFEVPRETRFVSISHFIADELQREAHAATRDELVSQRALTQAALEDEPEVALVAAVARATEMA